MAVQEWIASDGMTKHQGGDATMSRARILVAAAERFGSEGFDRCRVEDIGRDVGMSRAAILYHFGTKHQLYSAVLEEAFSKSDQQFLLAALKGGGTLEERMDTAIDGLIDLVVARPELGQLILRDVVTPARDRKEAARSYAQTSILAVTELIARRRTDGRSELRVLDAIHFASALWGFVLLYITGFSTFVDVAQERHLSAENIAALKREVKGIARYLLGIEKESETGSGQESD